MLKFFKNYQNRLGLLLYKKVFITYFGFAILFSLYQVLVQYDSIKKNNNELFTNVEFSYSKLYSSFTQNQNQIILDNLSDAILNTTTISGILLVNKNTMKITYAYGSIPNSYQLELHNSYNFNVEYSDKLLSYDSTLDDTILFKLFIDKDTQFESIKEAVYLILFNLFVSMIILTVLLFIFTSKYFISPLINIINEAKKFDIVEHELIQIKTNNMENNELLELANTFNKMSKKINEAYINMQQLTMIREIQKNKLENQKNELIEANKSKDDFLANMSHELKTPLNSINLISDVMMKNSNGNLDNKQIKNLEIVNKCGRDLQFLINDVLDLSRLEAGQIELNYEAFSLKEFVKSVYEIFEIQTKEKSIDLVLNIDDSIDLIYSDENRLKQIIKNLLSNSLKFTDENKKINIDVKDIDSKNIAILVSDEGIGIESEKLEHIFKRFNQGDSSTTRKYGGTGLGLAICKELSLLLEGDISVQSEVGKGSCFKVVIPKNTNKIVKSNNKNKKAPIINKDEKLDSDMFLDFDNFEEEDTTLSDEIIVLNDDPIGFFNIIIELNKKYKVTQCDKVSDIIKKYNENNRKVLVKFDKNIKNDLELLKSKISKDLILYSKDDISLDLNDVKIINDIKSL